MLKILNRKSGVFGISGVSSDFRDLEEAANNGNERAQLALDIFAQKIKAFIGAYLAELDGADVIVFTAGIGENSISMRAKICANMENLGIKLDPERNNLRGDEAIISAVDSKIKILLIPTNEELMIARDTVSVVEKNA
jgi:acetate kinase